MSFYVGYPQEDYTNYPRRIRDKFCAVYEDDSIGKEDIFYYVYGVLHSSTYREDYTDDLKKMLPRIPFVKDFWGYSKAGRELANWHLNYETIEPYPLEEVGDKTTYHVEKMRFGKSDGKDDKSVIVYNSHLAFKGIPLEAYEYVVNGKSALEWIMEQYAIKVNKASGIKNDPNEWAKECGDERYIADLVKRIVRVSLETVRIVNELPPLEIIEDNTEVKTVSVEPPKPTEKKERTSISRTMRPDREYVQREIRLAPLNDDEMRALSVKQPWAALIANGRKTIEHRTWQTDYRGELLICASGNADRDAINHVGLPAHTQLPLGAAVCVVDLIECRPFTREDTEAACMGEYAKGYAWVLSAPRPIEPFAVKGQLHIFTVKLPHEIADKRERIIIDKLDAKNIEDLETFIRPTQHELFNLLNSFYGDSAIASKNNYLLVKGEAPILLVAHLDRKLPHPVVKIVKSQDGNIWSSPQGIGGDDRNGVYALVQLYERSSIKPWLLFTCDEEIGCLGAEAFAEDYKARSLPSELDKLKFIVEIDRRGSKDSVYYDCKNSVLEAYIEDKGFNDPGDGTSSDISKIAPALDVAAVNLSAGYYDEHTVDEYINVSEVNAIIESVLEIISDATQPETPRYEYIKY